MAQGKNNQNLPLKNKGTINTSPIARNLPTKDLGAVIFGCKYHTFTECMNKRIFGLPSAHYSYVRNIMPGLPLFLFNFSDRKMYGIFVAKSSGQKNIDEQAWASCEGADSTPYSAQVRIDYRTRCKPLSEDEFKPIIQKNYYAEKFFWFELDKGQTRGLIQLFMSSPLPGKIPLPPKEAKPVKNLLKASSSSLPNVAAESKLQNLDWEIHSETKLKMKECGNSYASVPVTAYAYGPEKKWSDLFTPASSSHPETSDLPSEAAFPDTVDVESESQVVVSWEEHELVDHNDEETYEDIEEPQHFLLDEVDVGVPSIQSSDIEPVIYKYWAYTKKMTEAIECLNFNQLKQRLKMDSLEQELVHSKLEINHLKKRCHILESLCSFKTDQYNVKDHETSGESVFIVGGYDGHSWLSDLSLYSPLQDSVVSRCSVSFPRLWASAAKLNGELYIIGGKSGTHEGVWYDTVESYNPMTDQWTEQPSLSKKKGSMAAAALYETIFAMGGGNGDSCFSDVELLESTGSWMPTQSMLEKRMGAAAADLNGAIYVAGGYDGKEYLSSVERFDPRQHGWSRVPCMNSKRGSHSLVALKDELYALGGYDGVSVVPTVEVFDSRIGSWMMDEPMTVTRVNFGSFVYGGKIYVIGGMQDGQVSDVIERYGDGSGWEVTGNTRLGKRSFFSALVL